MKIIFLDIDGVLNSRTSINRAHNKYKKEKKSYLRTKVDMPAKEHIDRLNKIIEATDAKVVITSTWRKLCGDVSMWNYFLVACGFKGQVLGTTPILNTYRGLEIETWLKIYEDEHATPKTSYYYEGKIESFIILDDDNDMLNLKDHLVLTNNKLGLQDEQVEEAIKKLNETTS